MSVPIPWRLCVVLPWCWACGSERSPASEGGGTQGGVATAVPGDGSQGGETGSGESASAGSDAGRLDVADDGPGGEAEGTAGDRGCQGIDFLFVVDSSGSMHQEQQNLIASFPGFVTAMREKAATLGAANFNVLVTDASGLEVSNIFNGTCRVECPTHDGYCSVDGTPCEFVNSAQCHAGCIGDPQHVCPSGRSCGDLYECDTCGCALGEGIRCDKERTPCGIEGDRSYMGDTEPDLETKFACLAEVGTFGNDREEQVGAILGAVSPEAVGPGGINEGFLRDDAILVVTVITDEDDGTEGHGTPGQPPQWVDALVAAKAGDAEAVVVLGLMGDLDAPVPPLCVWPEGEPSPRLRSFVQAFPRHVTGSVCAPSYDGFFAEAVDLIAETCEQYVPPVG